VWIYLSTAGILSRDDKHMGRIVIMVREHPLLHSVEEHLDWSVDVRVHWKRMVNHDEGGRVDGLSAEPGERIEGIKPPFLRMM
jgi:hypothetical protein